MRTVLLEVIYLDFGSTRRTRGCVGDGDDGYEEGRAESVAVMGLQ